jgi:hypothetical protein
MPAEDWGIEPYAEKQNNGPVRPHPGGLGG